MNTMSSFFKILLTVALSSNLAQAEQANIEKATQLIVCASVYQITESMLITPATGKTSNAELAEILHNKQKILITKALQLSSPEYVRVTRKQVVDRLIDKTMDEYAAFKSKEISYSDFLLMKYDKPCTAFTK